MNLNQAQKPKKIAVLTSGGDAPGMNATIYGFVAQALSLGLQPYVVHEGYQGLMEDLIYPINLAQAYQHFNQAGSFIGSARSLSYQNSVQNRKQAADNLKKHGIEGLFVIGGDGSYKGAQLLLDEQNFPVVTAPGTIDNDVASSTYTIGYFSALSAILESIANIQATANTHKQSMIIEVMGRHCIDLSVFGGIISGVDAIVTNQNPFSVQQFIDTIKKAQANGKRNAIFIVSELTYGQENGYGLPSLSEVAKAIEKEAGFKTRVSVLGYLQRGHAPTAFEILQAIGFGKKAVDLFLANKTGVAIGSNGSEYYTTKLDAANKMSSVNQAKEYNWQNNLINLYKK